VSQRIHRNNIMYAGKKIMYYHKGKIFQMNENQGFYYYFHFVCLRVCLPSNIYNNNNNNTNNSIPISNWLFFIFISNGRPLPSSTRPLHLLPYLARFSRPRYTKTHGPEPIDLVNSVTVIVIIIVVVDIVVVWCSVVMRKKYS